MGGGFLVGGWYCGAGGAMRKREIEEREENKKNYWKLIKKHFLNEMVKNIEVLI